MVSLLVSGFEESKGLRLHLSSPRVLTFEDDLSTLEEEGANLPRNVCIRCHKTKGILSNIDTRTSEFALPFSYCRRHEACLRFYENISNFTSDIGEIPSPYSFNLKKKTPMQNNFVPFTLNLTF